MKILFVIFIIYILFQIPTCYGMGLIFKKMKLDFKKGIIPFYNKIILINYYKLPQYNLILMFIPLIGLYTNYLIYQKICKQFQKEFLYIIQLTLFPFIYNIFLGLEIKPQEENINNYFEDQKNMYTKESKKIKETKIEDEYIWKPRQIEKNNIVYKASRNNLNSNIKLEKNQNIIDNKKETKKQNENQIICPQCKARMASDAKVCFLCGAKLK